MTNFCEIELTKICPNPKNPRRSFDAKKLGELTDSVRQKGVIEPIIVRPVKAKKTPYEIVAGERRFRAAAAAGLAVIPAIVRELDEDEAYDFMLIENLQRDDLTDREEAESFKGYIGRHGEDAIAALAEKTGISPAYIRGRAQVLALPVRVLKAWDEGKLCFGHLQQLLRTQGEALEETVKWIFDRMRWDRGVTTVREIQDHIDDEAPALSGAFFKVKDICAVCPSNSTVQKQLFDVETKGVHCLNPACFKKHQGEWLTANWKTTAIAKANGTNSFRFHEELQRNRLNEFYDWEGTTKKPGKKCAECPEFVSVIELTGRVTDKKSCAGEKSCYEAITNPKSAKEKATGERDPEAPRAKWHGEFHRDVFLSKRIPEVLAGVDVDDPKVKALLLACAIHGNKSVVSAREDYSGGILMKTPADQRRICKAIIEKIVLSGQHVGPSSWNGFGTKGRRLVAEYLGIDLAKEYAVNADYLNAKTKAEILAFAKKFKLLDVDAMKGEKKTALVEAILNYGPKLIGKVPAEILK